MSTRPTAIATLVAIPLLFAALASFAVRAEAVDATAAEALIKKSKCGTCHSLDKKKEGPTYKETAKKYQGKDDAQKKLFIHMTTSPKVKVDGKEETHDSPKTKSDDEIKNLVAWILSR